jgi:hypothetical protein
MTRAASGWALSCFYPLFSLSAAVFLAAGLSLSYLLRLAGGGWLRFLERGFVAGL